MGLCHSRNQGAENDRFFNRSSEAGAATLQSVWFTRESGNQPPDRMLRKLFPLTYGF